MTPRRLVALPQDGGKVEPATVPGGEGWHARFGSSGWFVRLTANVAPGAWRIAVRSDVPVRLALETPDGPLPLRLVPTGDRSGEVAATFAADCAVGNVWLWPVEGDTATFAATLEPIAQWNTLAPDWRTGSVRQPPRAVPAPRTTPPTPPGWLGLRIAEAEAVTVERNRLTTEETGLLRLDLDPPLRAGWVRLEGTFRGETGQPALVEPTLLALDARHPRDRIAALRPAGGARCAAVVRLVAETTTLLLRPREQPGTVVVQDLAVAQLGPVEIARHAAEATAAAVRGWRAPRRAPRLQRSAALVRGPSVTLVTATKDAPAHLARYLSTVGRTAYAPFDIVLVDNGTTDLEARSLLAEAARTANVTVLTDARPFNFAALNNAAVQRAGGDIVVFANNDIEFVDPGWLAPLVEAAMEPDVGIAGARLIYPGGRVQHAGLVLAGEARVRHAERWLPGRRRGHEGRQTRRSTVVAVTGALMAIRRTLFHELGRFDAARYGVLLNDVDLCLRAHARGLANMLVPQSVAVHHESASIGQRRTDGLFARGGPIWQYERAVENDRFRRDWAHLIDADPCYPGQFDPLAADFTPRR